MRRTRKSSRSSARPRPAARKRPRKKATPSRRTGFVGRDPSPVLDRYPPKDPGLAPRGPPSLPPPPPAAARPTTPVPPPPPPRASDPGASALPPPPPPPPPPMLLSLARPFDLEEFSQQLGENAVELTVPRDQLGEALRRVAEFMGFGIYVYEITVRPEPTELLNGFVVRLQRVDFRPEKHGWAPFEERGRSDSPFGPEGRR